MKRRHNAIKGWVLVLWIVSGCGADAIEGPADDTSADDSTTPTDTTTNPTTPTDTTPPTDTPPDTTPDLSGPVCGDGAVSGQEACDGTQFLGTACDDLGFDGGTLACTSDCKFDLSGCTTDRPICGDGVLQSPEVCDTDALGGLTCQTLGLGSGALKCASSCTIDPSGCEGAAACGDGLAESGEACDGQDFNGTTCTSEGFVGGTLLCNTDCTQILTIQCTLCGDNAINPGETCDGSALNSQTCQTLGFDAGTLTCTSACAFDTTGCTRNTCGNATLDPDEDCEGSNLNNTTCQTLGASFDAGTLSCNTANCTFNTTNCTDCGDSVAQGAEACDGPDLRSKTCQTEGFDGGSLACTSACALNTGGCTQIPAPSGGQAVITEVMHSPLGATSRDWFELHNVTAAAFNLEGCRIDIDSSGLAYTIQDQLLMAPGAFLTFAGTGHTAFTANYIIPGLSLDPLDVITLSCGAPSNLVDEVLYISGPDPSLGYFPALDGSSLALKPAQTSAGANDEPINWCMSAPEYEAPDRGSPGVLNPACPTGSVDFCRLQYPDSIGPGATIGALPATVYGRVYEQGLTDQSASNNTDPNLIAQGGFGPFAADPRTADTWTWLRAIPNPDWTGAEANNDEYQADFPASIPTGDYSFTFRFSFDAGTTWLYCDLDGARSDSGLPFSVDQMGTLEVP